MGVDKKYRRSPMPCCTHEIFAFTSKAISDELSQAHLHRQKRNVPSRPRAQPILIDVRNNHPRPNLDKSGNLTPIVDGNAFFKYLFQCKYSKMSSKDPQIKQLGHRDMTQTLLRLSSYHLKIFSEHTNVVHVEN